MALLDLPLETDLYKPTSIVSKMTTFYRQQEAFESLTENQQVVFQNQSHGQRYYVVCTNREYWDKYLNQGDRYGYEVIRRDLPCHLYIDLDINKEAFPNIKVCDVWSKLESYVDMVFRELFSIPIHDLEKKIHYSSCPKKGSMHIIYNVKGKIFRSNAHCGAFMRGVRFYVESMKEEDMVMFDEKWVDMGIYTPNRLFRMLGCSKYGQDRFLENNNAYTYEEWVSNKVQPVHRGSNFIDVRELDGSEPKYRSYGGGITGWQPDCMKDILEQIEEEHAKVTRVHAFPLKSVFACNLNTKLCPFKGEPHSKNGLYANIKLNDYGYTVRCHSDKCRNRETMFYPFNDSVKQSVKMFLEQDVCLPAIVHGN
tara:strand:+ start:59 stop:1159 length:1101 start_codon:yes stop_codon:yes gene_type:complete